MLQTFIVPLVSQDMDTLTCQTAISSVVEASTYNQRWVESIWSDLTFHLVSVKHK